MSKPKKRISDAELLRALQAQFKTKEGLVEWLDKQDAEESLYEFVKLMWHVVEPVTPFVEGWHIKAICQHLEAVTRGEIKRLLVNISPGSMKSLIINVFYPAWEWGPKNMAHLRYVSASYNDKLPLRDNGRFKAIITSPLYRRLWGDRVQPTSTSEANLRNSATGWKVTTSIGGMGTGIRGDRFIIDDPNNVKDVESDTVRAGTNNWFREVVPNRVNSLKESAIIVVQQRTHEEDVSGVILANKMPYCHLVIPMEFDPTRKCKTSIGWEDPRTEEGELMNPERFDRADIDQLKKDYGPYATAGQLNQSPVSRGGNIIKRADWQGYQPDSPPGTKLYFPPFEFMLASLDTAHTEETKNDPSALTVWGLYKDKNDLPKIMLVDAWEKHLTLHGPRQTEQLTKAEEQRTWGVVEWVAHTCKRWKVDRLLIEAKATGLSVAQEIIRLHGENMWGIQTIDPKGDKYARLYSVQPLFADHMIYAPDRDYANMVINQVCSFPNSARKDLTDTVSQALEWFRKSGMALRREERQYQLGEMWKTSARPSPLYEV